MNKDELIEYWKLSSLDDYEIMNYLFEGGKYSYSLFFGHLSIEKLLKAILVKNNSKDIIIPKNHNLIYLSTIAKIDIPENLKIKIQMINTFNIATRYDDYKHTFANKCTKEWTQKQIENVKEVKNWLKNFLK